MREMQLSFIKYDITEGARLEFGDGHRMLYSRSGEFTVQTEEGTGIVRNNDAWFQNAAAVVEAGFEGAQLWCWELSRVGTGPIVQSGEGVSCIVGTSHKIELPEPASGYIFRLDRVNFPLSADAFSHIHIASGIRCLLQGSLLLEMRGIRRRMWPGDSWLETPADTIYAKASSLLPTSFIRAMVIPEEYRGKSTIKYVDSQDDHKPKLQEYHRYLEASLVF